MKLAGVVLRNSAAGIGSQLAIKVLSFGFSVLVVRQLGAEQFGQYAAALAFGATFVFLADLGLGVYVVREVSRWRADADGAGRIAALFGDSLALRLVLGVVTAGLLVLAAWLTDRPPTMILAIAIGALGLIAFSVQGACESVLAGFERLDVPAIAKVANQLVFVVGGTVVLVLGIGYVGLTVAGLLGALLMTAICWRGAVRLGARPAAPSPGGWLPLLRASAPFAVIAGTLGLSYKFDSVVLNLARGDAETGYYNAAYALVFAAVFLSNGLNTALYPSLTRQAATDPTALPAIYARVLRYLLMLSLPIAVGGWALADQLVTLLYGASYAPAGLALAILIWVVPLMFASELLGYIVVIRGAEGRVARAVLLSTGVNVAANLALVPWLGLLGAAVMTVVTEAILVGQYVWYLRSDLAAVPWWRTLGAPLLASLVMGGLALALRGLPVVATVAAGAAVYGGLLLVLGVVGRDELRLLRALRRGEPASSDPTDSDTADADGRQPSVATAAS